MLWLCCGQEFSLEGMPQHGSQHITYSQIFNCRSGQRIQLLTTNGWSHRIPDRQFLERLVSASQRVVVAVSQEQWSVFARAITGLSNGYLSMAWSH